MTFNKLQHVRNLVNEALLSINVEIKGCKMAELGNQILWRSKADNRKWVAKKYFTSLGVDHHSFDWNGENGAITADLGSPTSITSEKFDIITNIGTSEHVYNQYWCWRHIHEMCKKGGVMVHHIPYEGNWPGHCPYRYTSAFFAKLSKTCGYKIIRNEITSPLLQGHNKRIAVAILVKKNDNNFISSTHETTFAKSFGISHTKSFTNTPSNRSRLGTLGKQNNK